MKYASSDLKRAVDAIVGLSDGTYSVNFTLNGEPKMATVRAQNPTEVSNKIHSQWQPLGKVEIQKVQKR